MANEYQEAFDFLFGQTYRMWKSDLQKIFRIGTRGTKGGCNLSSCILVFIGIESFSLFFSKKTKQRAFEEFIDKHFDAFYRSKMGKIYDLFRHGLAHNFYPKSEFKAANRSRIVFGVDEKARVIPLSRLRRNMNYFRPRSMNLSPQKGQPYLVYPQVLFLDTVSVMEGLKRKVKEDENLGQEMVENYRRVRMILRH